VTENVWLGLVGVLLTVIAALGGLAYRDVQRQIATLTERQEIAEKRRKRIVMAVLALNTTVHPDTKHTIDILRPLIENGDAD